MDIIFWFWLERGIRVTLVMFALGLLSAGTAMDLYIASS